MASEGMSIWPMGSNGGASGQRALPVSPPRSL